MTAALSVTETEIRRGAVLYGEDRYRAVLTRQWGGARDPWMCFVMLNPSTADAERDDRTIRRCMGFARREGLAGIAVVNLYDYRSTDPKVMFADQASGVDIVGSSNFNLNMWVSSTAHLGGVVVAAWGANARPDRVAKVMELPAMGQAVCLGTTKDGHPKHPLYLAADTPLVPFGGA